MERPRQPDLFRPADEGVDIHHVLDRYPGLDVDYALTCDTRLPLVFVPFAGKHQLIDGWHRLAGALLDGNAPHPAELSAFTLTQGEADAVLLWKRRADPTAEEGRLPCAS